jgi:uncharacterized protein (TIGR02271 family)
LKARTENEIIPDDENVIPIIEEEASISKRAVTTGRVRVETRTEFVEEMLRAELTSDEVEVERIPVDREIDRMPDVRSEGDTTIVPVVEERLVVERRLFLKEELHVRRRAATETVEVPVTLRKQRVEVVRSPSGDPDASTLSHSED